MFYLFEIFIRIKYILCSFCLLLCCCYLNYNIIFTFFDYNFRNLLNGCNNTLLNYYIYTHPFELYYTQLIVSFQIALYCIIPYFAWQLFDFMKTALYQTENKILKSLYYRFLCFFLCSYYLFYTKVIPLFFVLLDNTKTVYLSSLYQIFFELKVQDFIIFILYLNNLVIIILFFLFLLIYLINFFELRYLIIYKKILYFSIIIFSTFISPPDIFSQIILLFVLIFTLELIIFIKIYNYYKNYGKEFVAINTTNTSNK